MLDSSVLISAFLTPHGAAGAVLDAAQAGLFVLCLSREIITETATVLLREEKLRARYGYDRDRVEEFCDGLLAAGRVVTDLPTGRMVPDDPKDDIIIATALVAEARFVVTGDRRHLLSLGTCGGIAIMTPRRLLDLLSEEAA